MLNCWYFFLVYYEACCIGAILFKWEQRKDLALITMKGRKMLVELSVHACCSITGEGGLEMVWEGWGASDCERDREGGREKLEFSI